MKDRKVTFLIGANIANLQKNIEKANRRIQRFASEVTSVGKKLTAAISVPVAMMAAGAVTSAIDFESAFAGVRKTVDATEVEFAELRQGIRDMSKELPTSAIEIAGVAEAAGQLGIQTDKILGFSKVMVMLGDTTNMAAQDAAMSLARFANIMQLPQDQFDRVGSTIVDLGNNFATTEAEITEFATRIAGAGQIAGLLPADVFAISTALSSVGVQAEAGGTATQKALIQMNTAVATGNKHLQTFAETAGMSAQQFQKMWREDAGKAFTEFINGLSQQGDQAVEVLRELGLADQRLVRAFLSLANAGDLVNRTLSTARGAWAENTALINEAQQRYDTVAARLGMLRNRVRDLAITFGDRLLPHINKAITYVNNLADRFESMSQQTIDRLIEIGFYLGAAGPIVTGLGVITSALMALTTKVGLVIGAVAGLSAGLLYVYDNWQAIIERVSDIGWWRNAIIDMIQFLIEYNPFSWLIKGYNELVELFGGTAINNPFESLADSLDRLKVETREYEHQFKGFWESIRDATTGLLGLDFSAKEGGASTPAPLNRIGAATLPKAGRLSDFGAHTQKGAETIKRSLEQVGYAVEGTGKKFSDFSVEGVKSWDKLVYFSKQAGFDLIHFMSSNLSSAISSFAESVGLAMSGTENSFATGLEKILLLVADFAKKLGQMLIAIGTAIMLVPGLQGPSGLYIAGGSALTAIATGVAAGIEKRISNRENRAREMQVDDALIRSDGSVIKFHPDDNILAMKDFTKLGIGAGGRPMRLHLTGELRARGSDLVLALDDARYTLS